MSNKLIKYILRFYILFLQSRVKIEYILPHSPHQLAMATLFQQSNRAKVGRHRYHFVPGTRCADNVERKPRTDRNL